jgi:hypothetical protein
VAEKDNFLELERYLEKGKKKWKLRFGLPYWLKDSKGEIENDPYILDEHTDTKEFAAWISKKRVLIPVKRFDNE